MNQLLLTTRKRLAPGYSALWLFDEGAGGTLKDRSGNGNHGTLGTSGAAPTWTATGLSFDGGDAITCGTSTGLAGAAVPYSIQIAFTKGGDTTNTDLAARSTSNGTGGYGWFFQSRSGETRILQMDSDASRTLRYASTTTSNTDWQICTAVWDGTSLTLYNGATPGSPVTCGFSPAPSQQFTIGRHSYVNAANYVGSIAAIVIYPFALTQKQILRNCRYIDSILNPRGIDINL